MSSWGQDIRHAVRSLVAARNTTVLSVVCLSLGIGVNTLVFSAVNGILLRPLPFVYPDRLVLMHEVREGDTATGLRVSFPTFRDWQEQSAPFAELAALRPRHLVVSERGDHERYASAYVTWNLFTMLGVQPALGRGFQPDDDRAGAAPVVLLSDTFWQRQYGADPAIAGRSINVDGQPFTVIGVMPPGFSFPRNERLWVPLTPVGSASSRGSRTMTVYARLATDFARIRRARGWSRSRPLSPIKIRTRTAAGAQLAPAR